MSLETDRDVTKAGILGTFKTARAPVTISRYEVSRSKALELFSLRGYWQVSMRDLASHLGLKSGSLYHHFPSKQHLLFELIEEFYEDLRAISSYCLQSRRDCEKALRVLIRARLTLHREHPFHTRLVLREVESLDEDLRRRIEAMKKQYTLDLTRLITPPGEAINSRLEGAAHVIAEMLISLPEWLETHPLSEFERGRIAERLVMGALHGLRLQEKA